MVNGIRKMEYGEWGHITACRIIAGLACYLGLDMLGVA